jgi:hypothetical protein
MGAQSFSMKSCRSRRGKCGCTVQQVEEPKIRRSHTEVLAEIHARLKASGHVPPTVEEVALIIEEARGS